jgi:uncharacterized membrane protein
MDDLHLERTVRFAAFLISGALLLGYAVPSLTDGVVEWSLTCTGSGGPSCNTNQVWFIVAPIISGAILLVISGVLFFFAFRTVRGGSGSPPAA